MPLRAVIFDYGMVLSGPPEPGARARLLEISGLSPEIFDAHYWRYRLDYDRGTLNGHSYWPIIAREAGVSFSPQQIEALIEQDVLLWATLDPIMLEWVNRVRASGMKIAILSNMGEELLAYMRENFGWLDGFHHLTWSCELNLIKPMAAIYEHTLEKLNVRADEALFIDDRLENVEGARAVGIHSLLFRGVGKLQEDLQQEGLADQLPPLPAHEIHV
ncbi:MAG TPA: HAD family phosphatase [Acidobacteriaceae bacterium]|nr:HAD family phosphatase [Acidobacteriaceae bacterium]